MTFIFLRDLSLHCKCVYGYTLHTVQWEPWDMYTNRFSRCFHAKHSRCTFDRFMAIKPAVLVLLPLCSTVWATGTEIWCWSGYSLCARTEIQASVSMERFGPPHLHTDSDSLRRNVRPRSWQWSPSIYASNHRCTLKHQYGFIELHSLTWTTMTNTSKALSILT